MDHLKERGIASVRSYEVLSGPLVLNGTVPLLTAARARNISAIVSSVVIAHEHVERIIAEPGAQFGSSFDGWYVQHWPYAYVRTEIRLFERFAV